eukprot:CAMPEP_0202865190 /NCGR_PEP_ID=MMETSP1391-20130828/5323_1 /ASSEMBLY_ACC=CAM_ASM_000867 /TAXON_ID=1034604 /ORGANISM="Chlamydomonas leiostraca, Strain SAG 11-49" /LENGTH=795 /DNA_ID=CAMNT_0049544995 /DNA_START=102 /DNA_END=2489 /DNA_ORIENTATION=-
MTLGLVSCALVALLLAAGTNAAKRERMLQQTAGQSWATTFPYYPMCDRDVDHNLLRISSVSTTATAAGQRVCYLVNTQDCPETLNGKPNPCCVGWTINGASYPANAYKFEIDIKPSCRNAAPGGTGVDGPKVTLADGSVYKLDQTYQPIPNGGQTMRLMMAALAPLGLTAANADGAEICFTLSTKFNGGSCDTIEEFCADGSKCLDRVTLIESDKVPAPYSYHMCCPIGQPKYCNDYLPATGSCDSNYIPGNDWWRNGANAEIGSRPGDAGFAAELKSKCCEPDCDGYAGQCGAGSKKIPNVGTHPINANNFQSVCCNQDCTSADSVYNCSPGLEDNGLNPALSWPLNQAQYDSMCCTRTCGSARSAGAQCASLWEYSGPDSKPLSSVGDFTATCCRDNSCRRVFPGTGCPASTVQTGMVNGAGWNNDQQLPVSATQATSYDDCCLPTCRTLLPNGCDASTSLNCGVIGATSCPASLTWGMPSPTVTAQCCTKLPTCDSVFPNGCPDGYYNKDPFTGVVVRPGVNAIETCCIALQDQYYPFPYCKCEGKYLKAQADLGVDASGEGYLTSAGTVVESNRVLLPFRLVKNSVSPDMKQMCLDLHYLGAGPAVGPKAPIKDWCYAQKTVHRIEFLSQKSCTKGDFKATFSPAGESRTCEMGVEDQWENQATGIESYNTVIKPSDASTYNEVQAASKITKIGAYLDKCMGFPLGSGQGMESLIATATASGGAAPYNLGTFCINMIKSTGPCTDVEDFCGNYPADKPFSPHNDVRCEWALMESSNQRCCPVQTTAAVLGM